MPLIFLELFHIVTRITRFCVPSELGQFPSMVTFFLLFTMATIAPAMNAMPVPKSINRRSMFVIHEYLVSPDSGFSNLHLPDSVD